MAFCTTSQGSLHGIRRLDRENYRSWARYMEAILEEDGLFSYAQGTTTAPDPENAEAVTAHERLKKKCMNKLILSISEDLLDIVDGCDDPKDIWEKFRAMFQPKTRLRRLQAFKEFLTAKLLPGEDVQLFVNRVRRISQDAIRAGCEPPTEETLCYVLLMGLPEEYSHVVTLTETLSDDDYTSQRIESLIVGEYRRRLTHSESHDDVTATQKVLVTRSSPKKHPTKKKQANRSCWICGETTHLARHCKKRQQEESVQGGAKLKSPTKMKPKVKTKVNATTTMTFSNSMTELAAKGSWIMDSGASAHMTACRSNFQSYKPLTDAHAYVANNQKCRIQGVGTVSLETENFTIILTKVYHVPEIACGIISVGELSKQDVKIIFQNNSCLLVGQKDQKVYLRARRLEENLYEAQIKAINGRGPLEKKIMKTSIPSSTDKMIKWHRCLAHTPYDTRHLMQSKKMAHGFGEIPL